MKIALLGADINNTNLGCQALTWSLLSILEKIRKANNWDFKYYVFEVNPNETKTNEMLTALNIARENVEPVHLGCITDPLRTLKYAKRNSYVLNLMKSCDIAFDVTRGDSFSDLYGTLVFNTFAYYKWFLEKKKIPLVLAPQTYGPFLQKKNAVFAKKIFDGTDYILSRDNLSDEQVLKLSGKRTTVTTDLAFQLPYENRYTESERIKVGINISGLLSIAKKDEYNQNLSVCDKYNALLGKIIEWLLEKECYEIYLVPHVTNDVDAISQYKDKYPNVECISYIDNPQKIKEQISSMDIFIGSRMHATIGALSSGVVTIPLAYSRKFKGVFELLDYKYTLDLNDDADDLFMSVTEVITNWGNVKKEIEHTHQLIEKYNKKTNSTIEKIIAEHYRN